MSLSQRLSSVNQVLSGADLERAERQSADLTNSYPDSATAWEKRAVVAIRSRKIPEALRYLNKAIALDPGNFTYRLLRTKCLYSSGKFQQAVVAAVELLKAPPGGAKEYANLGVLLSALRQFPEAMRAYGEASKLKPHDADIQYSLATVARYQGDVDSARRYVDQCLDLNPADCEAQLFRSQLYSLTADDNHIEELEAQLEIADSEYPNRCQLHFALAKEHEDLGNSHDSFTHLRIGADIRRANMRYSVSTDESAINKIIECFDAGFFQKTREGCENSAPIFVVGLPRTGSTLIERILSSHPDVTSVGEIHHFAEQMIRLAGKLGSGPSASKLQLIENTKKLDWKELGEAYTVSVERFGVATPYFVDKLPFNSLYLGLISLALPNAKIIHTTRDPMAACYAIYKHFFKDAYPYSYDQSDLGRYYVAHRRLMDHWRCVIPTEILDVPYESVVQDTRNACKRILDYCGLDWHDDCAEFHKNKAASTTASATQVRQPIYASSLDQWRNYQTELAELESILKKDDLLIAQ